MRYHYEPGTVRWFRHEGTHDVRAHRPADGWEAQADRVDYHPVTGRPLRRSEWWIRETYSGMTRSESLRDLCEISLRCLRENEYPALRQRLRLALEP